MISVKKVLIYLAIFLSAFVMRPTSKAYGDSQCCSVVQQALRDVATIKAGMKRRDVEINFKTAGGITFQERTTYVYKNCEYIKVDIDFEPGTASDRASSSNDTITSVSRLSLDYPAKD